jgi:hypothetical protein
MDDARFSQWQREAPLMPRRIAYHGAMADKYRRAARRFWLPVEPDPPEPE